MNVSATRMYTSSQCAVVCGENESSSSLVSKETSLNPKSFFLANSIVNPPDPVLVVESSMTAFVGTLRRHRQKVAI
jgi:hypothetical protein